MTALRDLLDPAGRQRLERLADPNPGLAEAARAAAADAAGPTRLAWPCAAVALDKTWTPAEAGTVLAGMIEDDQLRTTAIGCLDALCRDGTTTRTP